MRESYGSTLLITIMMIFVIMIVCFTAVIVNIAKTFRVKNQIINYVEQYKYGSGTSDSLVISEIEGYLDRVGYQPVNDSTKSNDCLGAGGYWGAEGYCIAPLGTAENQYYKVTVYVSVSLPFFDLDLTLPISGESRSSVSLS